MHVCSYPAISTSLFLRGKSTHADFHWKFIDILKLMTLLAFEFVGLSLLSE